MLHLAFQHDAAGLKASVGVVWKSGGGEMGWSFQLVKHKVRVQVAQDWSANRTADWHAGTIGHVCASNHLQQKNNGTPR